MGRNTEGQEFESRRVAVGEVELGGSHYKVPDARDLGCFQDPTGRSLAEIPNKSGIELIENISSG